jgi:ABC-type multidrug transport system permease subunit
VFYRERAAGMYGPYPMAIAMGNVEIPYILVQTVVYSCIVYWMVGFAADASKFFWFTFIFGITLMMFTAYGTMSVMITPDKSLAGLFMAFFFAFFNLFCGFLIPQASIPGWWIWMYWLNPLAYTLYALIVTQLGDLTDTFVEFNGEMISVPQLLEDRFGYKYSFRWPATVILIAFLLVFRMASIAAIKVLNFQRR